MSRFRLFLCCFLSAFSYGAQAGAHEGTNKPDATHRQEKLAGRAGGFSGVNDVQGKNRSAYAQDAQDAHEKKPLSKEEKRALRRQVNEAEIRYPGKN